MVSDLDPKYPLEDKCRHCGEIIGYALPGGEGLMLGCCDKKECIEKEDNDCVGS